MATPVKTAFILGAGFSKPAGMPLATELLPLVVERLQLDEASDWLERLQDRVKWLSRNQDNGGPSALNIEQVFRLAHFDIETHRLRQQLAPVGRYDGETPWRDSETIEAWLSYMEEDLVDVLLDREDAASLDLHEDWAKSVRPHDVILTFNYDTLTERALDGAGKDWCHGPPRDPRSGIPVFTLHGSIDWIVVSRFEDFTKCDPIFEKENQNLPAGNTQHVEESCRLWRFRSRDQKQELD